MDTTTNPLSSFSVERIDGDSEKRSSIPVVKSYFSWILKPEDGTEVRVKNSDLSTIFLLLNSMIGSGIVVQAYVFSQSGIIVCIFEYIVIAIMNYVGINLLVQCAEETKIFDFSGVAEAILGPRGALLVDGCMVIGGIGAEISYILIVGSVLTQVMGSCSAWYCNVVFLTILPVCAVTVPLCLLRNYGHLAIASYFSIAVICASVLLVLIGGPSEHPNAVHNVRMGNFLGAIRTIGDIVFALGYITAAFPAYNAMENRSISNFNWDTSATMLVGAVLCFCTGLAGYLSFGSDTDSNVLENFGGTVGAVFKVALVIHLVLYIPGDFVIMRTALYKLRGIDPHTQADIAFISTSLSLIGFEIFVALMLQVFLSSTDSLAIVVDITGGVAGSMLYFVVPGLCGMTLFKDNRETYYKSILLLLFGVTIMVLVIISDAI